jgi:hypothetical protein
MKVLESRWQKQLCSFPGQYDRCNYDRLTNSMWNPVAESPLMDEVIELERARKGGF